MNCPPLTEGRVYNFSAGPSMLPETVVKRVQESFMNYNNTGTSVMEMSHRSKDYLNIANEAEKNLRELLKVPDNYKVLFLQGGAFGQFSAIPMNLLGDAKKADYVESGNWSSNAIKEGKKYCEVNVAASSKNDKGLFEFAPKPEDWKLSEDSAFVHYCDNETVHGVEYHKIPEVPEGKTLIADMSSNLLSKEFDVSKFGMIYAGAQKNCGPAGVVIVIIREDLLGKAHALTPTVMNYKVMADADSMKNTPPTLSWYICGENFKYIKEIGGVAEMEKRHKYIADTIYNFIDESPNYVAHVAKEDRSRINIPFNFSTVNEDLVKKFLEEAKKEGLANLKGYRTMGGFRASVYNGMPTEGADALVAFMKKFEKANF